MTDFDATFTWETGTVTIKVSASTIVTAVSVAARAAALDDAIPPKAEVTELLVKRRSYDVAVR